MLDQKHGNRGGVYDLSRIAYVHDDARQYLASGADVIGNVVGVALISTTFLGKMISNLFITLGAPRKFEVRFFENPIRAEHWLRSKMNELEMKERAHEKNVA